MNESGQKVSMTIGRAFDESVVYYDEWVKTALPSYDEIFAVAQELIPFAPDERIDVLDLGAGTGLFSQHVRDRYPNATFVLYDVAAELVEVKADFCREGGLRIVRVEIIAHPATAMGDRVELVFVDDLLDILKGQQLRRAVYCLIDR